MGISQMHVSRLLRSALNKLHEILEEQDQAIRAVS
jgi:DNA-directed RNA polymerase specialized sigma subunit